MDEFSRRSILSVSAAGVVVAASAAHAASFGNPDLPPEGAMNVTNKRALTDPGPQDPALANNMPTFLNPPATDVNGMPQFWSSFNLAPKRIQDGGWARQITQDDFAISTTIAGVNMRLGAAGVRELHWHQQAEWAVMTYGNCPRHDHRPGGAPSGCGREGGRSVVLSCGPAAFAARSPPGWR
jgi:oxalate decarboxylase